MQRTYRAALRLKGQCTVDGLVVGTHKRQRGRATGCARPTRVFTGGKQHDRRGAWVIVCVTVGYPGAAGNEVVTRCRPSNQRQFKWPAGQEGMKIGWH